MSEALHANAMKHHWLEEANGDPDTALNIAERDFSDASLDLRDAREERDQAVSTAKKWRWLYRLNVSRGHIRREPGT